MEEKVKRTKMMVKEKKKEEYIVGVGGKLGGYW